MIQKLVSAFVLISLFIGIVGLIGMVNMSKIDKNLSSIYNNDLKGVNAAVSIKANLLQIRSDLLLILDPKNKNELQIHKDDIQRLVTINNKLIVDYKTTITTELDKQQFAEFEKLLTGYRVAIEELTKTVEEGDYKKANELVPNASKLRADMVTVLEKELALTVGMAKDNYDNSQSSYKSAYVKITMVIVLGLIVAIGLGN